MNSFGKSVIRCYSISWRASGRENFHTVRAGSIATRLVSVTRRRRYTIRASARAAREGGEGRREVLWKRWCFFPSFPSATRGINGSEKLRCALRNCASRRWIANEIDRGRGVETTPTGMKNVCLNVQIEVAREKGKDNAPPAPRRSRSRPSFSGWALRRAVYVYKK